MEFLITPKHQLHPRHGVGLKVYLKKTFSINRNIYTLYEFIGVKAPVKRTILFESTHVPIHPMRGKELETQPPFEQTQLQVNCILPGAIELRAG